MTVTLSSLWAVGEWRKDRRGDTGCSWVEALSFICVGGKSRTKYRHHSTGTTNRSWLHHSCIPVTWKDLWPRLTSQDLWLDACFLCNSDHTIPWAKVETRGVTDRKGETTCYYMNAKPPAWNNSTTVSPVSYMILHRKRIHRIIIKCFPWNVAFLA